MNRIFFHKTFFICCIQKDMDPQEELKILNDIVKHRRIPYSIELLDVDGDKITIRNNFGSTITYLKKDDDYILQD